VRTFTHPDTQFRVKGRGRGRIGALDRCVYCREELDPMDEGQIYAHHACWSNLSQSQRSRVTAEMFHMLREPREGGVIDFSLDY
jgi:hypothetical protein